MSDIPDYCQSTYKKALKTTIESMYTPYKWEDNK